MKNVIITILLIIVLCLGGYLVYDKVIDKKDNNVKDNNKVEENTTNETEERDYNLDDAKKLMETYVDDVTSIYIFNGLDSKVKLKIAYKNLNYSSYPEIIPYDEMNKVYKKLFGNIEASKQRFIPHIFPCDSYNYDEVKNSYIYKNGSGCGGVVSNYNYSIKSATVKNSNLDIVVYYYEIDPGLGNLYGYHQDNSSDYNSADYDKYKIADLSSDEKEGTDKLTDEAFEKYKDKFDTFTFRFEKYNDNYVLKDVFKN